MSQIFAGNDENVRHLGGTPGLIIRAKLLYHFRSWETTFSSEPLRHFLVASDFDQTLSFNDSGIVLGERLGVPRSTPKSKDCGAVISSTRAESSPI